MNEHDMLEMVKALSGDSSAYVSSYLQVAKGTVVSRLFPYDDDATWSDVPERHHFRTCEIAAYLVNKRGAEGETQHIENGITRTYSDAYIPKSMLADMVPFVGIPS